MRSFNSVVASLRTRHDPSPGASRHPLPVGEGWSRESLLPVGEGARRADEGRYVCFLPDAHGLCRGSLTTSNLATSNCPRRLSPNLEVDAAVKETHRVGDRELSRRVAPCVLKQQSYAAGCG